MSIVSTVNYKALCSGYFKIHDINDCKKYNANSTLNNNYKNHDEEKILATFIAKHSKKILFSCVKWRPERKNISKLSNSSDSSGANSSGWLIQSKEHSLVTYCHSNCTKMNKITVYTMPNKTSPSLVKVPWPIIESIIIGIPNYLNSIVLIESKHHWNVLLDGDLMVTNIL